MFIYLSKPFDIQEPVVLFALCGSSRVWNQESPVALKRSYNIIYKKKNKRGKIGYLRPRQTTK